ncbi:MAG: hypothetical protein EOP00_16445 [Pedobacter sp.]|nr:MAG: hypothetical protein EOP00_16445 [Pedobacter sp.]
MKLITFSVILLSFSILAKSQQYLVFEKQNGINSKFVINGLSVSQNDIELKNADTTLTIYNWYYKGEKTKLINQLAKRFSEIRKNEELKNDIIFTAVPIIKQGEKLIKQKITKREFDELNKVSDTTLLKNSIADLYLHLTTRNYDMPSLKTLEYGLIIKDGNDYFKVLQNVLFVKQIAVAGYWYYPNQFRDAVLSIHPWFVKTYKMADFDQFKKDVDNMPTRIKDEIKGRIYCANVDKNSSFEKYIFSFWEYPYDDVQSIYQHPKKLKQYHPGLGSFDFIQNIGVLNCTMDYYLKNKVLYNQKSNLKIEMINGLPFKKFVAEYNEKFPLTNDEVGSHIMIF